MNHHPLEVPGRSAAAAARASTLAFLLVSAVLGCGDDTPLPQPVPGTGEGGTGAAGTASLSGGAGGGLTTSEGGAGAAGSAVNMPPAGASGSAGDSSSGGGGMAGTSGGGGVAGSGGVPGSGGVAGNGQEPKKAIKVWMAGDSTMQECSSACPCGWGSRFDKLFDSDVTVVNRAVGGRSIQTWLYEGAVSASKDASGECTLTSSSYAPRWREMLDSGSGMQKGDYLFVQFGINDSTSQCPRHVGQEKFKSYLVSMAKAAVERGATPVLVAPVSAISCSGATAAGTRGGFVGATKTASTTAGVPFIDLHQLSIERYTALGLCPNDGNYGTGKVGAFFCQDHTHFEGAGADEIAKLVAKAAADAKLPLARYLLPAP